ncbi:MAG: c-type cytochrome [Myxococcales bacterium]|nr:c-type cytochrome [Myxococcales bacterium]
MRKIALATTFLSLGTFLVGFHKPTPLKQENPLSIKAKKAPLRVAQNTKKPEPQVDVPEGFLMAYKPLPKDYHNASSRSAAKIDLGRMLYYDTRLSKNHDLSCNSCHKLDNYGVDNEPTSVGHKKQRGDRNSPTVYNAAGHFVQFWDGRSPHVEHQATQPVLNPVEMAIPNPAYAVKVLKSIPGYVAAFKKAYPKENDPVTYKNMGDAIGAFERGLVTPSRWDAFLNGKKDALTNAEKQGFIKFVSSGCLTCHIGPQLGGHMYQKAGLIKPWPNQKDKGRGTLLKDKTYDMFFKVPGLRNIAKTAPYMHDGSVKTLPEAVAMMARHQLGRELSKEDIASIVTFLNALTGSVDANYIKKPALPASSATTPKADPN